MGKLFPHGLTGIIFDCDGVMIDSRAANAIFYNKVLAALGTAAPDPGARCLYVHGHGSAGAGIHRTSRDASAHV